VQPERWRKLGVVAAMNRKEMARFFAVMVFVTTLFALVLFLARPEIG
jgi:hypothetical protein